MATHNGGFGKPLDRDTDAHETSDAKIQHAQEFHHITTKDLEDSETNNPTRLTPITRQLGNLCQ